LMDIHLNIGLAGDATPFSLSRSTSADTIIILAIRRSRG